MAKNPLENINVKPTKEDLEDYLGLGRFRRFDKIYDEMIDLDMVAKLVWDKVDNFWLFRFHYKENPLYDLKWGIDYFYTFLLLKSADYLKITNNPDMTSAALDLVRKYPENRARGEVRVEANMEKMIEQEGFFDLLPVLQKVLA